MTLLRVPPSRAEAYAADPNGCHWTYCGAAAMASVIQLHTGKFIPESQLQPCGATTASYLAKTLTANGVPAHAYYNTSIIDALDSGFNRSHFVIPLVVTDRAGEPVNNIVGHWILGYGSDMYGYHFMNPAYGYYRTYSTGALGSHDNGRQGVEVDVDFSVVIPTPAPGKRYICYAVAPITIYNMVNGHPNLSSVFGKYQKGSKLDHVSVVAYQGKNYYVDHAGRCFEGRLVHTPPGQ